MQRDLVGIVTIDNIWITY